ncbi:type IV conjugative transfer system protein TraL [Nitrospira moscoviensis]|uniref:Type IV conjugative transfer system protein TraL n=1 Tax=Nitrospira moscoviensis TaxID=42253 RepID=A0A0K2GBP3_NITMO|nr:type IV conjugative transfer system protein TraL [Nitrospira moscoviensis]ALA58007.1 hypothetical protein NITMOv2_1583 [Nitrospira moscoviensis]
MPVFIPRYMDNPPQIAWWELDELIVLILCGFIGILTRQLTSLLIVGLMCTFMISTLKSGKSDGFIFHCAYWYGIPGFDLPQGPQGTIRELIE